MRSTFLLLTLLLITIPITIKAWTWPWGSSSSSSCSSSSTCSGSKICLSGKCKACGSHADCLTAVPSTPYCKGSFWSGNSCKQCLSNSHCTSASASRCSSNRCTDCSDDSDCDHIAGNKKVCSSGQCVECSDNSDCTTNQCDSGVKQCRDAVCSLPNPAAGCTNLAFPFCDGYFCRSCGVDETICTIYSLLCAPDGSCKACFDNEHCTDPMTSRCNTGTNLCVICQNNDDCSQIPNKNTCSSTLGCVQCVTDSDCTPGSTCTNSACVESNTPIKITLATTSSPDTYTIQFPSQLVVNTDVIAGISITLDGIDTSTYTYVITKTSTTTYSVRFTITKTIPITTLQLIYMYSPTGSTNLPTEYDAAIATKRMAYIPEAQKALTEAMEAIGQTATVAMSAASGSMLILGGNPAIMWALINLIQTFYYLIFVNVNYPANVQFFLKIFTLAGFDFIPNPMTWVVPDLEEQVLPTPARFEEYEINGLFLENAGNMMLIWAVVFIVYGVAALGNRYLNRMSNIATTIFAKVVFWFEWGGVLRALTTSYAEIAQASFLQLRVLTYESDLYAASSVTGILFAGHSIVFPILVCWLTRKYGGKKTRLARKYKTLTEEFDAEGTYSKYFTALLLLKRTLIIATLVFLHDHPYVEIFILTALGIVTFILFYKIRPYETKKENYLNIITEALFFGVHIMIVVLIHDDHILLLTETDRLNVGWILIGICGIIVLLTFGSTIVDQIVMAKEAIELLKKLRSKKDKPKKKRNQKPAIQINGQLNQFEYSSSMFDSVSNTSIVNTSVSSSMQDQSPLFRNQSPSVSNRRKVRRPNKVQDIPRKESHDWQ